MTNQKEWVQCACDWWIHAKYVDEVIIDANGKERFCLFYVCVNNGFVNSSDFYPCIVLFIDFLTSWCFK